VPGPVLLAPIHGGLSDNSLIPAILHFKSSGIMVLQSGANLTAVFRISCGF
jgi:hypothetical protein